MEDGSRDEAISHACRKVFREELKNSPREAHSPTEKKHAGNRFLASGLGVDKLRAQSNLSKHDSDSALLYIV